MRVYVVTFEYPGSGPGYDAKTGQAKGTELTVTGAHSGPAVDGTLPSLVLSWGSIRQSPPTRIPLSMRPRIVERDVVLFCGGPLDGEIVDLPGNSDLPMPDMIYARQRHPGAVSFSRVFESGPGRAVYEASDTAPCRQDEVYVYWRAGDLYVLQET